jgi:hypothetical protein
VDAGVGSARAAEVADARVEDAEGAEELAGDGARVRLRGPAGERPAVVGDGEQDRLRQVPPPPPAVPLPPVPPPPPALAPAVPPEVLVLPPVPLPPDPTGAPTP